MNYIIIDFEMNPIAYENKEARQTCRCEIIEIGAVVLDEQFLVLGEFRTLVKPQYNDCIYGRYETLTGINTNMVAGAPVFASAYKSFVQWCNSYGPNYEIYAWSDSDYKQLVAEMTLKQCLTEEMMKSLSVWNDFQAEFTEKLNLEHIMSLEKALNYAGIEFEGKMHTALDDAKNTATLFSIVRDKERCDTVLKSVFEALTPTNINGTLGEMFNFKALLAQ